MDLKKAMDAAAAQQGLDFERLSAWLASEVPGAGSQLSAQLIMGGRSNFTYEVSDGVNSWILRRPPIGQVLATAHDMAREYRVMLALQDTDVPVPKMYAFCADSDVIGAPFYLMERVVGRTYRYAGEVSPLGPERTAAVSSGLVETLAVLHEVDPEAVGLADMGRPEGFLARQVGRWKKQLDASRTRDLPAADELYARLAADIPAESATGIVHGDYRLDNVIVDAQDHIAAVIDWEMATIGDPLTDLALMAMYGRLGTTVFGAAIGDASSAPGFLSENEIIARYAAYSERDLSRFGFYLGLASFKLAAILEGIRSRHLKGQAVSEDITRIDAAIHPLLDTGLTALKEHV
jgi:aminoglycoside phosphotransferase (APT) family kinase protein